MISFALCLPHTPWVPERVESFDRLTDQLSMGRVHNTGGPIGWAHSEKALATRIFCDREPNRVWAQKMWRWACTTSATHLWQIQDDVTLAPEPWAKLRAMVEAVPDQIIGLEAAHPIGPELALKGQRWYRTRAWLVGPSYAWPLSKTLPNGLPAFLDWCDMNQDLVEAHNEDDLVNVWAKQKGFDIWHPIPTIIDHDVTIKSTYANDGHLHRRPTVLWTEYPHDDLANREFWRPPFEPMPQRLMDPYTPICWFCGKEPGRVGSAVTGARIGADCFVRVTAAMVGGGGGL